MRFGICAPVEKSGEVKRAGWDFVEESVQTLLQGQTPEEEWQGPDRAKRARVPILAANVMVPAQLKITGPEVHLEKLRSYANTIMKRARQLNVETIVFGSGGARQIPDHFDRHKARQQIIDFLKVVAHAAEQNNVTVVVEHLTKKECNVINSVAEAMTYVKAVANPHVQCLVDSYHFWTENETLVDLRSAVRWIRHVHVADKDGRVPPGESGTSDYKPFFHVLKSGGYNGAISVESPGFTDIQARGPKVLEFLKKQWEEA